MASADTINASSLFSSSSSSSSSSLRFAYIFNEDRKKYAVFLSFRGSDTRINFTDHLFHAMIEKDIYTFRDDEKLERGKFIASELLTAIEQSKFAVVVLTRNYAASTWCLSELAKIVECMETKKLIVLPIFYHVDPRDVRDQTGDFAVAIAEHEERFRDSTKVSLWRDALTKVANISGWVLNCGDPESQLIHEFIESLSNCMPEDGSTNSNLPPRFDVTPDESDDADDDADEMVQDYEADLPLIALENESLSNLSNRELQLSHEFIESLSNRMPEDGSTNWNLPPRFDVTPSESDDAAEMVQDYVADLPLIALENESLSNLSNRELQLSHEFIESLSNRMPEDGSTNWNLPPRFDVTPYESDDAAEMVQDYVADLPLIALENESLSNLSNRELQLIHEFIESLSNWMPEDGSTNWNLPPTFDVTPYESDDDADEMVQDYVADLPLEVHVVPDDVADVPQEAHVVEDHVANLPQEAHVVEDHVANLRQQCAICVTNARGMAFLCGHTTCVECGERFDRCPICREPIIYRIRLFLE